MAKKLILLGERHLEFAPSHAEESGSQTWRALPGRYRVRPSRLQREGEFEQENAPCFPCIFALRWWRSPRSVNQFSRWILAFAVITFAVFISKNADSADPRPVVIIHGAWGGPHHWKQVAHQLTHEHGFGVSRASLTGLGERSHLVDRDVSLETHVQDVVNLITYEELDSVILIAHSYGGLVASGVMDQIPGKISQAIYVDAFLLEDGETFFTHHPEAKKQYIEKANQDGDGWLVPVLMGLLRACKEFGMARQDLSLGTQSPTRTPARIRSRATFCDQEI